MTPNSESNSLSPLWVGPHWKGPNQRPYYAPPPAHAPHSTLWHTAPPGTLHPLYYCYTDGHIFWDAMGINGPYDARQASTLDCHGTGWSTQRMTKWWVDEAVRSAREGHRYCLGAGPGNGPPPRRNPRRVCACLDDRYLLNEVAYPHPHNDQYLICTYSRYLLNGQ